MAAKPKKPDTNRKKQRIERFHKEEYGICRKWMPMIRRKVSDLVFSRRMLYIYRKMVNRNPEIQDPLHFHNWIDRMVWALIALGIRTQVDVGDDAVSLLKLLRRMRDNPEAFSIETWLSHWEKDDIGIELRAIPKFRTQFADRNQNHVSLARLNQEIEKLTSSSAKVASVASRMVAHIDRRGLPKNPGDMVDAENAATVIAELTQKYSLFFLGNRELLGPPDYQFTEIFSIFLKPWTTEKFLEEVGRHQHDWESWGHVGRRDNTGEASAKGKRPDS
ncbi:MAG: hypothetical protein O7H41_08390 [Planctomycetota bacterium]|nr:hypothetical protein [Planctomycetota bacterium]